MHTPQAKCSINCVSCPTSPNFLRILELRLKESDKLGITESLYAQQCSENIVNKSNVTSVFTPELQFMSPSLGDSPFFKTQLLSRAASICHAEHSKSGYKKGNDSTRKLQINENDKYVGIIHL